MVEEVEVVEEVEADEEDLEVEEEMAADSIREDPDYDPGEFEF